MNLSQTIFELIDMRSFSNLWFWIALAVVWSSASHWVLGVPWDLALRAKRKGGQFEEDFETLLRINVNRLIYIYEVSGLVLTSFGSFVLTTLLVMGFYYRVEFAQAVFLIAFPLSIVGWLSMRAARKIRISGATGDEVHRRLLMHRLAIQGIGVVSIFVTALWGMLQNLTIGALG
ncbi:component of SufBCD complex [Oceanicola sp. 22II-s10i]|uniref:component of SufBCD complex n=1 Tax=Oceanicola sp. 22II-s10i TaxID=1317116 RepID=UPI000B526610|nr:component of SufBCD complex [Oceanicola sp. 22II-s10i]OWU83540.1 component of SufBCD complex [Oceanicola sp. 22II-s10i]